MKLSVLSARELSKKLKATVQKTGRLGFTQTTAETLNLKEMKYVKFYFDEEREKEPMLHFMKEEDDESFKAILSGDYYYLNTAALFDKLGYDYRKQNVICDLVDDSEARELLGDNNVYRLVPRNDKRRKRASAEKSPEVDGEE